MLKSILSVVPMFALSLVVASNAQARDTKAFTCTSKLDYPVWKNGVREIKTVDFKLTGARSERGNLAGGAMVEAGKLSFELNLPSHSLSDSVVVLRGTNLKEQASLSFVYMKDSDGSYNHANSVTVRVRHFGYEIVGSNEILGTEDTSDYYPIECVIE